MVEEAEIEKRKREKEARMLKREKANRVIIQRLLEETAELEKQKLQSVKEHELLKQEIKVQRRQELTNLAEE